MDKQINLTLSASADTVSAVSGSWPAGVSARVRVVGGNTFKIALATTTPASITAPVLSANVLHDLGVVDVSKLYASSATASAQLMFSVDLI